MCKKILFFMAGILFIFTANVSAEPVNISEDNLEIFVGKCNAILRAGDPNSSLDVPAEFVTSFDGINNFSDRSVKIEDNLPITITYGVKNDKIFSVMLSAEKYDETAKKYFDGLSIIFLKSLGLTDDEVKGLLNEKIETTWQKEGFVSRFDKKIVVRFLATNLIIFAENK